MWFMFTSPGWLVIGQCGPKKRDEVTTVFFCFKPKKVNCRLTNLFTIFTLLFCPSIHHSIKNIKNPNQSSSLSSSDIQNSIHQNIYGKSLAITSTEAQLSTTIIENPEMLKYQQERRNSAQANSGPGNAGPESSAPKLNSVMNGESLEDIRKVGNWNVNIQRATQSVNCCWFGSGQTANYNAFNNESPFLHSSVIFFLYTYFHLNLLMYTLIWKMQDNCFG